MYTDKHPCSFISVAGHRFLTGFGSGGCPCAIIVVGAGGKGWLTACCNGGPQMASATIANAICKGRKCHFHILQMAFANHLRRTTATTLFEQRPPPLRHTGNHLFRSSLKQTEKQRHIYSANIAQLHRLSYVAVSHSCRSEIGREI